MACAICGIRRPKRFCLGVRGDICSICCGTEREVTVSCPLECEYLRDAHRHERLAPVETHKIENEDIKVTDRFIAEHEPLLLHLTQALVAAALQTPGAVDSDILVALESLIQTYRTLQSGVYYESRPTNPLAASIFQDVFEAAQQFAETERESGISKTRDSDILRGLVFLHRIGVDRKNGRPRGRAFLDLLAPMAKPNERGENAAASSLIVL